MPLRNWADIPASSRTFYWCGVHHLSGTGRCPRCAEAAQLREDVKALEARIADQDAKMLQLEHRTIGLEHRVNDGQRAHNVLATWSDVVEDGLRAMLAKLERGPQ